MIRANEISVIRSGRHLLDRVSIRLVPGRVTVVIGPNGAGKSTLLKALSGEFVADQGTVTYQGRSIHGMTAAALAAERAVLPQSTALSFPFTALEVVRMGAIAHGGRDPGSAARHALARVGLSGLDGRSYNALSGGEQQRVQLARVLAQMPDPVADGRPRAIFLDEPTASLDIGHQISVLELACDFARRGGAVFAILHDLNLTAEFADHLAVLHQGRLVAEGTVANTLTDQVVSSVYGVSGAVGCIPTTGVPYVLPQARRSSKH